MNFIPESVPTTKSSISLMDPCGLPNITVTADFIASGFSFKASILRKLSFISSTYTTSAPSKVILDISPEAPISMGHCLLAAAIASLSLDFWPHAVSNISDRQVNNTIFPAFLNMFFIINEN
jgi:hypothetical protein